MGNTYKNYRLIENAIAVDGGTWKTTELDLSLLI